jgi:putative transposase
VAALKFHVHDFVVMPDHVLLLIRVGGDMTIETAVQFTSGGFSFRLRTEIRVSGRGLAARILGSAGR